MRRLGAILALPLFLRAGACLALSVAAAAHLHHCTQRRLPGLGRLAVAAPYLLAFLLLPLMFSPEREPLAVVLSANWPCLSGLLVVTWVLGRGPLAPPLPFHRLLLLLSVPALPAAPDARWVLTWQSSLQQTLGKVALLATAHRATACGGGSPPGWLLSLLQSLMPYLFASSNLELSSLLFMLLSGSQVVPPFDRPYLSASLSEFWSKRWNLETAYRYRQMVYEPLCGVWLCYALRCADASEHRRPRVSGLRRGAAVCATFAVSGIVHELFFAYLARRLSGGWLPFFCLQGPLLIAEGWLRRRASQAGMRLPRPLGIVFTLSLLHFLARLLFIPGVVAMQEHFSALPGVCA